MKLIFAGTPEFAAHALHAILSAGHQVALVLTQPDRPSGRGMGLRASPVKQLALERGIEVYEYHFRGLLDEKRPELSSVVLVMQSVCVPRIAGRWPGPVVIVGKRDIVLDREVVGGILGGHVVPSGSSVAHMGLGVAWALGAGEVALIGQDLAFERGGRSHASGTAWERGGNETKIPKRDRLLVPAIDGGAVETTRTWKYFIDIFERMILELRMPVFDCTEGGAFIPGTVVRPFVEYLEAERPGCDNEPTVARDRASGRLFPPSWR